MGFTAVLEVIAVGAGIFRDERKRYFEKKAQILLKIIADTNDSDFYSKDMEAKGKAERDLIIQTEELRKEFIMEAKR